MDEVDEIDENHAESNDAFAAYVIIFYRLLVMIDNILTYKIHTPIISILFIIGCRRRTWKSRSSTRILPGIRACNWKAERWVHTRQLVANTSTRTVKKEARIAIRAFTICWCICNYNLGRQTYAGLVDFLPDWNKEKLECRWLILFPKDCLCVFCINRKRIDPNFFRVDLLFSGWPILWFYSRSLAYLLSYVDTIQQVVQLKLGFKRQ